MHRIWAYTSVLINVLDYIRAQLKFCQTNSWIKLSFGRLYYQVLSRTRSFHVYYKVWELNKWIKFINSLVDLCVTRPCPYIYFIFDTAQLHSSWVTMWSPAIHFWFTSRLPKKQIFSVQPLAFSHDLARISIIRFY